MGNKRNYFRLAQTAVKLRAQGKTWAQTAKTLKIRKHTIMNLTKGYFDLPSPRKFSWTDYMGRKSIGKNYTWKPHKTTWDSVDLMRTKSYPTWRWQLRGKYVFKGNKTSTEFEAEGWSRGHMRPDRETMSAEAINNARSKLGESADLVRILWEYPYLFKALKH